MKFHPAFIVVEFRKTDLAETAEQSLMLEGLHDFTVGVLQYCISRADSVHYNQLSDFFHLLAVADLKLEKCGQVHGIQSFFYTIFCSFKCEFERIRKNLKELV